VGGAAPEGISVVSEAPNAYAGIYTKDGATLSFSANEIAAGVLNVRFDVAGKVLTYDIDYNRGVADFNAGDAALEPADTAHITELAKILDSTMPERTSRTRVQDALVRQSALLAVAPRQLNLPAFQFVNDHSIICIRCACQNQYIGSGYYRQAGQGWGCTGGSGNGCKGHCGAGCASDLSGNYTQDCAKHDYGLGSFAAASDDYTFGGCWCG
jgi:hypothetical protein